jgi:hypothetical protein
MKTAEDPEYAEIIGIWAPHYLSVLRVLGGFGLDG